MTKLERLALRLGRELPCLELRRNEPMSRHTTFRVGGPAALMALPASEEELLHAAQAALEADVEPLCVGNGSNLLADDAGVDAFVLKTVPKVSRVAEKGNALTAGAGLTLAQLAVEAANRGLTGLEFAHGIPGSVGGGMVMNAGAYGGELCQVVRSVRAWFPGEGIVTLMGGECRFGYRHSVFSEKPGVVLFVEMELTAGDSAAIKAKMEELAARRRSSQPLELPSAGSTFKRPEGYYAGTLIDQ